MVIVNNNYSTVPLLQLAWLVETLGLHGDRWMVRDNKLYLLNDEDYSLFLLRWA